MSRAELTHELEELLKLLSLSKFDELEKSPLIKVKGSSLSGMDPDRWYVICHHCRRFIEQKWDHEDWCREHEHEPLTEFLNKGQNNGNRDTESDKDDS